MPFAMSSRKRPKKMHRPPPVDELRRYLSEDNMDALAGVLNAYEWDVDTLSNVLDAETMCNYTSHQLLVEKGAVASDGMLHHAACTGRVRFLKLYTQTRDREGVYKYAMKHCMQSFDTFQACVENGVTDIVSPLKHCVMTDSLDLLGKVMCCYPELLTHEAKSELLRVAVRFSNVQATDMLLDANVEVDDPTLKEAMGKPVFDARFCRFVDQSRSTVLVNHVVLTVLKRDHVIAFDRLVEQGVVGTNTSWDASRLVSTLVINRFPSMLVMRRVLRIAVPVSRNLEEVALTQIANQAESNEMCRVWMANARWKKVSRAIKIKSIVKHWSMSTQKKHYEPGGLHPTYIGLLHGDPEQIDDARRFREETERKVSFWVMEAKFGKQAVNAAVADAKTYVAKLLE